METNQRPTIPLPNNEMYQVNNVKFLNDYNQWRVSVDYTDTLGFNKRQIIDRPLPKNGNCIKHRDSIKAEDTHLTKLPFELKKGEDFLISFSNACNDCNKTKECTDMYINDIRNELVFRLDYLKDFVSKDNSYVNGKIDALISKVTRL